MFQLNLIKTNNFACITLEKTLPDVLTRVVKFLPFGVIVGGSTNGVCSCARSLGTSNLVSSTFDIFDEVIQ